MTQRRPTSPVSVATATRLGTQVVRDLLEPAQATVQATLVQADPWQPTTDTQRRYQRGANLTRRGLGLVVLLVLAVLGTLILGVASVALGVGAANGHALAGVFLVLTLLLWLGAGFWVVRRASLLLRAGADVPVPAAAAHATPATDELALLSLLHTHERRLPLGVQDAFRATVMTTRDALRLSAPTDALATLDRDTYDARQAAREDLPELMDAYQSVPRSTQSDQQLLEQLRLIDTRMREVVQRRAPAKERDLRAHGQYLQDKYAGGRAEG